MINELFPFQMRAARELQALSCMGTDYYQRFKIPQVISLQAPTGSGKTIIVASLMENNQTPEGIRVPKALVPYCGFEYLDDKNF